MTESAAIDRPPKAGVSRPRSAKPATVGAGGASRLQQNLHRQARQGDGFPLDQSRVAYLRYLRRERRQSLQGAASSEFTAAKAELIRIRIAEKKRDLIPLDEAISTTEEVIGLMLTHRAWRRAAAATICKCGAGSNRLFTKPVSRCRKPRASWPIRGELQLDDETR